jgi:hypothetical protein
MKAHLGTQFSKGFLLSEENLIKLSDIIEKRLKEHGITDPLQYKIYRVDGALLEVDQADAVTAEENSTRNAIQRLELVSTAPKFSFNLTFDPKEKVDLSIESEEKDFAYLLFSDVKEYLTAEVLKYRSYSFDEIFSSKKVMPLLLLAFPLGMFVFYGHPKMLPEELNALIASPDIAEKLNYLIKRSAQQADAVPTVYAFGLMFILILVVTLFGPLLDKIYPRNIFYWGKAAAVYDRFIQRREKIFWGILIASIISIASTVAVDYFKSLPKNPAQGSIQWRHVSGLYFQAVPEVEVSSSF